MFNSNKSMKAVSNTNNHSPSVNIISEGTRIKGNIHSSTDVRISGKIEGEAVSKGKLIITAQGKIIGNVTSSDADVAGRIEGEVRVSNKLILRQNAIIDGNIHTKSLIVEEGAQINGSCKMGDDVKGGTQLNDAEFAMQTKVKTA